MAEPADFLAEVLIEAPGVADALAESAVLRAATEFCQKAGVWSVFSDPIPVASNVAEYDIDLPADAALWTLKEATLNGLPLPTAALSRIRVEFPDWQTAIGAPAVLTWVAADSPTVLLVPRPINVPAGTVFKVRAVFAPKRGAATLPDFLADRYLYQIADGAKSHLLAMGGKAWTNVTRATELAEAFQKHWGEAAIEMAHDRVTGDLRVTPRAFGD